MQWEDKKLMIKRYEERKKQYYNTSTGMFVGDNLIIFERKEILNNRFAVMLPDDFSEIDEELLKYKYASESRPMVIKSNKEGTVNFTFNKITDKFFASDIEDILDGAEAMLKTIYPSAIFGEKKTLLDENNECGWMTFQSYSMNGTVFNFLHIKKLEDHYLLNMFNCPYQERELWIDVFISVAFSLCAVEGEE